MRLRVFSAAYSGAVSAGAASVLSILLFLSASPATAGLPALREQAGSRSLSGIGSHYGLSAPVVHGDNVTLTGGYTTIVFENDSRKLCFNGLLVWMHGPLTMKEREWLLLEVDVNNVLDPLLRADRALAQEDFSLVVLDPGHGGSDEGTKGPRGLVEKKLALDIAGRVGEKLRDSGVRVRTTRSGDRFVSLPRRCKLAGVWGADVFVSIHLNSAQNLSASGFETFVMTAPGFAGTSCMTADSESYRGNKHDPASMVLGYYIQKGIVAYAGGMDRGVKRARYQVLRDTDCPAALVECGFLSNREEEGKLYDPAYRDTVAGGIARGILTYLGRVRDAHTALDRGR